MDEAGECRGGRGSYVDKTRIRKVPLPPPTTPLLPVRATRLRIGLRFGRKTTRRLSITREGEGAGNDVGPTCQRQQPNCGTFSVSIYCFITWLRRHLQPSTLVASFNFNPRRHFIPLQLQSSLPTSSIVAANFNPCRLSISKPHRCAISSPSP
jgi:hypothetical protein